MLPAIVVGGWLGAGKTTLVNRLLRGAAGRRLAVLVNDFGAIGIDADLIVSREGSVTNLAGGCVCCAVSSDLVEALAALPQADPPFDAVVVETSGVALPGSVARSVRLVSGIAVDGTVVLVDAETVRARAHDRDVGDIVARQLAEADLLVVNKTDLIAPEALAALHDWIARVAPRAARIDAIESDVPADAILGPALQADRAVPGPAAPGPAAPGPAASGPAAPSATASAPTPSDPAALLACALSRAAPAAADRFASAAFDAPGRYDLDALARALADPALALVRAKGVVLDADGRPAVVQAVGARVRTGPAPEGSAAAATDAGRIVAIGMRERFDEEAVRTRVANARCSAPVTRA